MDLVPHKKNNEMWDLTRIPNRDGLIPHKHFGAGDDICSVESVSEIWKSDETFVTLKRENASLQKFILLQLAQRVA